MLINRLNTSCGVKSGFSDNINAATPATTGQAWDVPPNLPVYERKFVPPPGSSSPVEGG